jgi:hypothetical protein
MLSLRCRHGDDHVALLVAAFGIPVRLDDLLEGIGAG